MWKGSVHCETPGATSGTMNVLSPTSGPGPQPPPTSLSLCGDSGLGGGPSLPARRALTLLWLDQSQSTALFRLSTRRMEVVAICSKWLAQSRQPKKKRT